MYYEALLNIGSNEFGPVNEIEYAYFVSSLLASSLLNALIFGDIASLIAILSKRDFDIQSKLDEANGVMADIGVNEKLASEIREFFMKTINTET